MSGSAYKSLKLGKTLEQITEMLILEFAPVMLHKELMHDLKTVDRWLTQSLYELFKNSLIPHQLYSEPVVVVASVVQTYCEPIDGVICFSKLQGEKQNVGAVEKVSKPKLKLNPKPKREMAPVQQLNTQGKKVKMVKQKIRKAV